MTVSLQRPPRQRRVLTVWWDHWPIVAAGLLDRPAVVLAGGRVVACSPAAAADGVVIGQRRRAAQRRCPGAEIVPADPLAEARAFEGIVQAVGEFSPRLEVIEPGWLCLNAHGPARYFGGEEALCARIVAAIVKSLRGPGSPVAGLGIGVADGRAASAVAARLAARAAEVDPAVAAIGQRRVVVEPGMSARFLAPLNIGWLYEVGELDDDAVGLFARLGVMTCGRLAALSGPDVEARFGPAVRRVHALVGGHDDRWVRAGEVSSGEMIERIFDEPVLAVEPLTFVAKQLADELVERLDAAGTFCVRLHVRAETEHGERSERVWYRAAGLSAAAMVERVRWQLDGWVRSAEAASPGAGEAAPRRSGSGRPGAVRPGEVVPGDQPTAGVVLLRLEPLEVHQAGGEQLRLWGGLSEADGRALRAVSRLVGVLGPAAVTVPEWHGGRLPAERYAWVPAIDVDLGDRRRALERVTPPAARRHGPWPGTLPAPAPVLIFPDGAAPEVEVCAADGSAIAVNGRGEVTAAPAALVIDGRRHAVAAWAGPWPLDQRWWNGTGPGAGAAAGADPGGRHRARRRRLARFQLLTTDGAAHLVALEHRRWWLLATYA